YRIARPGSITKEELENVLEETVGKHEPGSEQPVSPGMKYKHYAPHQPLIVIEGGIRSKAHFKGYGTQKIGIIGPETVREYAPDDALFISLCSSEADYREAARNLYAALRKMDKSEADMIFIHGFSKNEDSEALMNRIYKA